MDLFDKIERSAFLGAEFITWLWFQVEENEGDFELPREIGSVKVAFADKLQLRGSALDEQRDIFTGGNPTESIEAKVALQVGKLVESARLYVIKNNQIWSCTLSAAPLRLSMIKLPELLAEEQDESFQERMYLTEQLEEIYYALLRLFLQARLSAEWEQKKLPEIRRWVAS